MNPTVRDLLSWENAKGFKILANVYEPFIEQCGLRTLTETKECPKPGLDAEIFGHLLRQSPDLDTNGYTIFETDLDFGEIYENGTWSEGQFQEMTTGHFDVLLTSMVITQQRLAAFELSYAVDYLPYAFVLKRFPKSFKDSSRLLMDVFSKEVWLVSGILIALLTLIGAVQKQHNKRKKFTILSTCRQTARTYWAFWRLALKQGREDLYDTSTPSGVLLTFTVYLFIGLTIGIYQSALLSHLYQGSPRAPFKTVKELVDMIENGQYRLVTDKADLSFFEDMDTSSDSLLIKIKSVMDKRQVHYVRDEQAALAYVDAHANYVYPSTLDEASYLIKDKCQFHVLSDTDRTQQLVYVFRKNFPLSYLRLINKAIGKSWPLFEHYKRKYYLKSQKMCEDDEHNSPGKKEKWSQLSMANVGGAIYLYALSNSFSIVWFLTEIVYYRTYCRFKKRPRVQLVAQLSTSFIESSSM